MTWEYRYIFASDIPLYQADGWELCGPMKGERYAGGHPDTVIVHRLTRRAEDERMERNMASSGVAP